MWVQEITFYNPASLPVYEAHIKLKYSPLINNRENEGTPTKWFQHLYHVALILKYGYIQELSEAVDLDNMNHCIINNNSTQWSLAMNIHRRDLKEPILKS